MKQRLIKIAIKGLILLAAGCAYAVFYVKTGYGIPCVFHLITGLKCPGCGVSRMLISLLKLDFKSAWNYNPAIMVISPFIVHLIASGCYRWVKYGKIKETKFDNILAIVLVAVLILFGVIRNIVEIF